MYGLKQNKYDINWHRSLFYYFEYKIYEVHDFYGEIHLLATSRRCTASVTSCIMLLALKGNKLYDKIYYILRNTVLNCVFSDILHVTYQHRWLVHRFIRWCQTKDKGLQGPGYKLNIKHNLQLETQLYLNEIVQ